MTDETDYFRFATIRTLPLKPRQNAGNALTTHENTRSARPFQPERKTVRADFAGSLNLMEPSAFRCTQGVGSVLAHCGQVWASTFLAIAFGWLHIAPHGH
jgi:hypothetical protein